MKIYDCFIFNKENLLAKLRFNILNNKLRFPVDPNMRSLYKNRTIKYIFRRGKYGFIILDGRDHIVFHLGMTGKFRLSTNLDSTVFILTLKSHFSNESFLIPLLSEPKIIANFKSFGIVLIFFFEF